jgi:hypothetical protein
MYIEEDSGWTRGSACFYEKEYPVEGE